MSQPEATYHTQTIQQSSVIRHETWCDRDKHSTYEYFSDFNDWIDSDEGLPIRDKYGIEGLSNPSKAFFAGDWEGYNQAFREYRIERRNLVLNGAYFNEQFKDDHWFQRNLMRFEQLIDCLESGSIVPFIGAGLSVEGGFPTWKEHLRQQGRTAGIDSSHINSLLDTGQYERVIEEIETIRGRDVFIHEVRDVFSKTGTITDVFLHLSELFSDTIITTNYDRLIEAVYDTGAENVLQIIKGENALEEPLPDRLTLIKLHGDVKSPATCILSKNQYNKAYGAEDVDLSLPIPKLLSYYYKNSNLLFLGCSLNSDRTIRVFQAVKSTMGETVIPQHFSIEQAPENEEDLVVRNAQLAKLGITAIWFEKGCFDYVENIIRLARNELRYRGIKPGEKKVNQAKTPEIPVKKANRINSFLQRFFQFS